MAGTEGTVNNLLAVDIGGTHFRVGLFDQEGRRLLVSEDETQTSGGREWMLTQVRARCQAFLKETDYPVKACGVSFGGPVDFERQRVVSIHSPGWQGFALAQWVQETLNLPCQVDNDANAGALGEFRFGAGRGTQTLVYITLSTGIGSGLICSGKILRGKDSMAGELGHMPVSDSGAPCSCGAKGCLETFCSGTAIARRGQEWANRRPEAVTRMVELSGGNVEGITAKAVMQAAAEGDMAAGHIVREVARWLARGLLTVVRIINPDKIVLGGGVSQVGTALLNPVRVFMEEFGSPTIRYSTQIVLTELGAFSPLYGAAAMAMALV
jgi:glucokinase